MKYGYYSFTIFFLNLAELKSYMDMLFHFVKGQLSLSIEEFTKESAQRTTSENII